jgi:protein-tyrosine phosphatase
MIDIHTHLLFGVDDGSCSLETSVEMAKALKAEGISHAIITPHYRGTFIASKQELADKFLLFKTELEKQGVALDLSLGQELYITKEYKSQIKEGVAIPINDKKFILCEFDYQKDIDVADIVYEIKTMGYKPIVAHLERYSYADIELAYEIKECGGYIQINAGSIVSPVSGKQKKLIKKLFKEDLVDFVASDFHEFREPSMKKAYEYVEKKFGKETVQKVFIENAKQIIEG